MNKLIIIGNGFDLSHNLKTTYKDFKNYIKNDDIHFYNLITKYIDSNELWSNFEEALTELDFEYLESEAACLLGDISDDDWRDSQWGDYQYEIDNCLSFADDIPKKIQNWIRYEENKSLKRKFSIINADKYYLNFNYSNTLESIYNIPSEQILYIHGKADSDDKLVIGHHDLPYYKKPQKEYEDFRIQEGKTIINSYYSKTFKDTKKIIANNIFFF